MATATLAVGRIDRIIQELERLQAEAQDIFNAHIDYVCKGWRIGSDRGVWRILVHYVPRRGRGAIWKAAFYLHASILNPSATTSPSEFDT
jgi:hypothetical protein